MVENVVSLLCNIGSSALCFYHILSGKRKPLGLTHTEGCLLQNCDPHFTEGEKEREAQEMKQLDLGLTPSKWKSQQ
jgi:hypothetical protein